MKRQQAVDWPQIRWRFAFQSTRESRVIHANSERKLDSPQERPRVLKAGRFRRLQTIERLAKAAGVTSSWLAFGEGSTDRPGGNCLVLPNVSLLTRLQTLEKLLQGNGGHRPFLFVSRCEGTQRRGGHW